MGIDRCPRVAVLSDDRLFCEGLLRLLAEDESIAVLAVNDKGNFSLSSSGSNPNVVLLDSRVPSALRVCNGMTHAGLKVLMVGAPDNDEWACDALDAGARGVVVKNTRTADLHLAVHAVHDGQIWARRRVLGARIDRLTRTSEPREREFADSRLSAREAEVLRHAATGLGNKEVADRLSIAEATVKVHLTHIFQKLGLRGRTELAAVYHGVVRKPRRQPRPSDESITPTR